MSYSETAALNAIFGILGTCWLLVVAYFVISIIANWKIFTKAGQAGWKTLIPIYNGMVLFKIIYGSSDLYLKAFAYSVSEIGKSRLVSLDIAVKFIYCIAYGRNNAHACDNYSF